MEEEWKKKSKAGRIIKICVILISLSFYLVFLTRLFLASDAGIADDIYLDPRYHAEFEDKSSDFQLYLYEPASWTNDDGTLQLKNIHYLPLAQSLQLTVKYNAKAFEKGADPSAFTYVLRKVAEEGAAQTEDPRVYFERRYGYGYLRVCFDGIQVYDGERQAREVERYDELTGQSYTTTEMVTVGGDKVYLDIYDADGERKLYSFVVAGKTVGARRIKRASVDLAQWP